MLGKKGEVQTSIFNSVSPGSGKTFISANLSCALAFAGKLDRSEDITPILNVLRATDKLTVEVNGKRIILGVK